MVRVCELPYFVVVGDPQALHDLPLVLGTTGLGSSFALLAFGLVLDDKLFIFLVVIFGLGLEVVCWENGREAEVFHLAFQLVSAGLNGHSSAVEAEGEKAVLSHQTLEPGKHRLLHEVEISKNFRSRIC